jgi:hypothetical protein
MIGFNHLGRLGRLGNQMFQYAALRGIAHNNHYNFCIPYYKTPIDDGVGNLIKTELFECFEMSSVSSLNIQLIDSSRPIVMEQDYSFNKDLFNKCPDWISLYGFFQTEKYFKNIKELIRKDFTFKSEILNPCKDMIKSFGDGTIISLHIRRTDYLTNSQNHNNLSLDYYEEALSEFPSNSTVIIFSDDPEWCKEQEIFSSDRFLVSENNSGYIDMCLMSLCSDYIIANSSFSWWGAWLSKNQDKKVIAPNPKNWFGPNNSHLNTDDILLENWSVL